MNQMVKDGIVPAITQGHRLRIARELTGLTVRDFAAEIGVSHQTVTNAEKDHREVRRITLNAWALRTGVSRTWLETGIAPTDDGGGDDAVGEERFERSTFRVETRHLAAVA